MEMYEETSEIILQRMYWKANKNRKLFLKIIFYDSDDQNKTKIKKTTLKG